MLNGRKDPIPLILIKLKWSAGSLWYLPSDRKGALTNQKASLSTGHDSGEYSSAIVRGRTSGQVAKDGRASACADAWGKHIRWCFTTVKCWRLFYLEKYFAKHVLWLHLPPVCWTVRATWRSPWSTWNYLEREKNGRNKVGSHWKTLKTCE